jgi:flavin reductase (DIM6/NTAB) family NADH-FMN oxidoreductase RutF
MAMTEVDETKSLATALGRIPSGLFIVTVRHGQAETGMLASWVQQCSFVPPRISVAIKAGREVNAWLTPHSLFVVNILQEGQKTLLAHFGKGFALSEPAFTGLHVLRSEDCPPVLREALAYLRCQVVQRVTVGDHDLLIGEVLAGDILHEGQPRVHIRKNGLTY